MGDLPSYPEDASERDAEAVPDHSTHDLAGWGSRVAAYLLDALILLAPLAVFFGIVIAADPDDGIRVVHQNGGLIGYGSAFGRYAITFLFGILFLPLVLDYLWPLWDRRNQALHDKVASSLVVRA